MAAQILRNARKKQVELDMKLHATIEGGSSAADGAAAAAVAAAAAAVAPAALLTAIDTAHQTVAANAAATEGSGSNNTSSSAEQQPHHHQQHTGMTVDADKAAAEKEVEEEEEEDEIFFGAVTVKEVTKRAATIIKQGEINQRSTAAANLKQKAEKSALAYVNRWFLYPSSELVCSGSDLAGGKSMRADIVTPQASAHHTDCYIYRLLTSYSLTSFPHDVAQQQHRYQDAFAAMRADMNLPSPSPTYADGASAPAALATKLLVPFSPPSTKEARNSTDAPTSTSTSTGARTFSPGKPKTIDAESLTGATIEEEINDDDDDEDEIFFGQVGMAEFRRALDNGPQADTPEVPEVEDITESAEGLVAAPLSAGPTVTAAAAATTSPVDLNDSLAMFEAMEEEALRDEGPTPAVQQPPVQRPAVVHAAAKPKFVSRLAKPASKLSTFNSPIRSSSGPGPKCKLPTAAIKLHHRQQKEQLTRLQNMVTIVSEMDAALVAPPVAVAAVVMPAEGQLINFDSPLSTTAAPALLTAATAATNEGLLISFDSPVPATKPVKKSAAVVHFVENVPDSTAALPSKPLPTEVTLAAAPPPPAVSFALRAMLEKADKTKTNVGATSTTEGRKPLAPKTANTATSAIHGAKSKVAATKEELAAIEAKICGGVAPASTSDFTAVSIVDGTAGALYVKGGAGAPKNDASAWSPVKKTATFDEIQNQYF
jgi:hypothetical protein